MDDSNPCNCDQCIRAAKLVKFAEEECGFDLAPWQRSVMLNLAKCSRSAIAESWFASSVRQARRRQDQTPPWARSVRTR